MASIIVPVAATMHNKCRIFATKYDFFWNQLDSVYVAHFLHFGFSFENKLLLSKIGYFGDWAANCGHKMEKMETLSSENGDSTLNAVAVLATTGFCQQNKSASSPNILCP